MIIQECLSQHGFMVMTSVVARPGRERLSEIQAGLDTLAFQRYYNGAEIDAIFGAGRYEAIKAEVLGELIPPGYVGTGYEGIFVADPAHAGQGFHWHNDGHFDGYHERSVNFWVPLRSCGPGLGAPGLDVVGVSDEAARALDDRLPHMTAHPGRTLHSPVDWPSVTDVMLGEETIARPGFRVGDILAFTDRTVHRTGLDGAGRRAALIARYRPA